ncbi:MAG: hypothetical protein IJZ94_06060 [Clostridia bacterium]|nr:hypothetical protein [Clostridia bacterium]
MDRLLSKIITLVLIVALLVTGMSSSYCLAAYEDEDNVTGGDNFSFSSGWDGTPSSDAWTFKSQAMWKVSVYVAKDSSTHYDTAGANLTNDYYKFGYTFWLYRDGYGPETTEDGGVSSLLEKTVVDFYNKEEYLRGGKSYTEKTYNSLKNRFFAGSDYGLNLSSKKNVPFIPGFGSEASDVSAVQDFFGNKNVEVSNALIKMAAKAGGITNISAWLSSKTFTINGETKSGWDTKLTSAIVTNTTMKETRLLFSKSKII